MLDSIFDASKRKWQRGQSKVVSGQTSTFAAPAYNITLLHNIGKYEKEKRKKKIHTLQL